MRTPTDIEQAIQCDTFNTRVAAERAGLVAGRRALADRLETGSPADTAERLAALHTPIVALLTYAESWTRRRPR